MKPGLDLPQVDGVTYEAWDLPNPRGWEASVIRPLRNHTAGLVEELCSTALPHLAR
jgi:hypothetical protein